jgi:hypothetical protein
MSDDVATMSDDACQSQIESTVGWIESSPMDRVESTGSSRVTHCMHELLQEVSWDPSVLMSA